MEGRCGCQRVSGIRNWRVHPFSPRPGAGKGLGVRVFSSAFGFWLTLDSCFLIARW